jgi:hypothetical protein
MANIKIKFHKPQDKFFYHGPSAVLFMGGVG